MSSQKKLKQLSFTLWSGVVSLMAMLLLSYQPLLACLKGDVVDGTVIDHHVKTHNYVSTPGFEQNQKHTLNISYIVDGESYLAQVNGHMIAALELVTEGEKVTVAYKKGDPSQFYVLSYSLYSVFVLILVYYQLLIVFVVFPAVAVAPK